MVKSRTNKRDEVVLPIVTAFSLVRGADGWQVLTLKVQGDKVLSVEATEPNMKAIALEMFKVAVSKEFMR